MNNESAHQFIPGVKLFGQTLCESCYRPIYHDCHWPQVERIRSEKEGGE